MNKKLIGFLLLGAAALVVLFWVLKPEPEPQVSTSVNQAPMPRVAPASSTPRPPLLDPLNVVLKLEQGKRVAGPELISAQQGQKLRLTVISDTVDELHVHGYDVSAPLAKGEPVELVLVLEIAGRFEIELHKSHSTITVLEVQPKP